MKDRILLFIPVYNCEKQIVRVLDQLDPEVLEYIEEVIVVNNRSSDRTEISVQEWMKKHRNLPVKLLRNNENYGLGGSHKVAFSYAQQHGFEYLLVLHGDDQGNIHDILPILEEGIYKTYDCCLGARFMSGSRLKGYSRFRTLGNWAYNLLFSLICGFKVWDLGSGLNIYCVRTLKSNFFLKYPDNLTFNYCMIMAVRYYKQKAMFFPISWREEDQISNVKLFSQAKKVLYMLFSYGFNKSKFMNKELRDKKVVQYAAQIIKDNTVK